MISLIKFRKYELKTDFLKIRDFLIRNYSTSYPLVWTFERWNYAYFFVRKMFEISEAKWSERVGIWENEDGEIISVVNDEGESKGEVFFQINKEYLDKLLFDEMFNFAEEKLALWDDGKKSVNLRILENCGKVESEARKRGYTINREKYETTTFLQLSQKLQIPKLPPGFYLSSMDIQNNLDKRAEVFAKAFGNFGTPDEVCGNLYKELQKSPDYKKELDVFVVSPEEEFVAFCLIWYDSYNNIGILEPVGTNPDFRKQGLGKTAVFEAIKRVQKLGAKKIIVGDGQKFYLSLGFSLSHKHMIWTRQW